MPPRISEEERGLSMGTRVKDEKLAYEPSPKVAPRPKGLVGSPAGDDVLFVKWAIR